MKRFGKFRDPRFALTTLQNPTWEVRTRAELVQAAQLALEHQPDAAGVSLAAKLTPPSPPPTEANEPPAAVAVPENANLLIGAAEPLPQAEPNPEPEPETETETATQLQLDPEPQPIAPTASHVVSNPQQLPKTAAKRPTRRKSKPKSQRQPPPLKFSKIIPGLDAAEFVAEALDRHSVESARPHREKSSDLPSVERHSRKCAICHHPDRADIEEAFLSWRNADLIRKEYKLPDYHTVYRHARTHGLYQRRRENLRFAAELLIEHADQAQPDANVILRAIHACARINDRGEWVEPIRRVMISPREQQAPFAPVSQSHQPEPEARTAGDSPHPQFPLPISINNGCQFAVSNQRSSD